jgi:Na+/H+-dicarboxylate symporter
LRFSKFNSFAVPFGATTKMDGCAAISPALAAIFIAQIFDVQLGIQDYLLIASSRSSARRPPPV